MLTLSNRGAFVPLVLLSLLFSSTTSKPDRQPFPQRITLSLYNNQFLVPVRINGRGPYHFLLDADASGAVRIDNRLAKELSLNIVGFQELTEGSQHRRVFLVGIDNLSIGKLARHNLRVRVGKYDESNRSVPIDGIVGLDFLANHFVQIDGPAKQLIVETDIDGQLRKKGLLYTKPYEVQGKIGSKTVLVNVDIGSSFSILMPTTTLAGVHYTDTKNQQTVRPSATSFVLHEAVIQDTIRLGDLSLANQLVYYSDKVHQITIGGGFLKSYIVSFDQRRRRVQIE